MGMVGPNIEPRPYNLAKMHKFYRSTNDVKDSIPGVQCSLPKPSADTHILSMKTIWLSNQFLLKHKLKKE